MAVLEAMAIGIPVIGGRNSGAVPSVLGWGEAGLLVDIESPSALVSGMRALLLDGRLRESLAKSGRQRALDQYRLEDVAAQYDGVLMRAVREQAA